ncbi:hypothetical protein ACQP2T_32785 [Nonomuraea sp. CA-143628]|uniref:hypothetical protein n=1 Tax=Nonomuraea sp. CA-143628 TaxID=3239997 RepID=UPI003D91F078
MALAPAVLGLEFAARAARDEHIRAALTAMRRAQREATAPSIAEVTERTGVSPTIGRRKSADHPR